ncbi:hypothetical protein MTBLM5_20137 [Magnetospirillum sp. LM-5]|nr:hypothetical protein MTBLM5_20137 [Magnetospirillum sp. LM-5]
MSVKNGVPCDTRRFDAHAFRLMAFVSRESGFHAQQARLVCVHSGQLGLFRIKAYFVNDNPHVGSYCAWQGA